MQESLQGKFVAIGDTFEYNNEQYVVKQNASCRTCSFKDESCANTPVCSSSHREDATGVVFVKLKEEMVDKSDKEYSIDGSEVKVEVKHKTIKVKAASGYSQNVDKLMTLKDNGNGWHVKTHSYSSVIPDHIFNLDYSELEYLYFAYKAMLEKEQ